MVYLEFAPHLIRRSGYTRPQRILEHLHELGYTYAAHAGRRCDQRWLEITSRLRSSGSFSTMAQEALQQPTWCGTFL